VQKRSLPAKRFPGKQFRWRPDSATVIVGRPVRDGGSNYWTPGLLDQFLASPGKLAPGTEMEFQELPNE